MTRAGEEYKPDYSITKDELIQDIDFYTSKIKEMHGNPFRLISEEEFHKKAEEIKDRIRSLDTDKFNIFDCYYFLQELAVSIQDGHTGIYSPRNWDNTVNYLFPFKVVPVDNRIFVGENLVESEIPERSEILSINGMSIRGMISETMKYVEGTLPHYKMVKWARYFGLDGKNGFLIQFLHTYFKMEPPWLVTYRHNDKVGSVELAGLDREEFLKRSGDDRAYSESSFTVDGEVVSVLDLPSLSYGKLEDFEKFIDDFFNKHKDKRYLVIDMRRCPGGNGEWGWLVLDYLTDTRYKVMSARKDKVSKTYKELIKDSLNKYADQLSDLYAKLFRSVLNAKLGTYIDTSQIYHDPRKIQDRFRGKVFLLVSHETFSAGVVFAAAFQYNKMGIVVGQETGGRVDFLSDPKDVELPNSKLIAKIPVTILVLLGKDPDRGVMPDIEVKYTIEDYINQKDKDLETVKELIKSDLLTTFKAS